MSVLKILAILNIAVFVLMVLLVKSDRNKYYLKHILISFPLLSIAVTNTLNSFDIITILYTLTLYRKRQVDLYNGLIYIILFFGLLAVIITGLVLAGQIGEETIGQGIGLLTAFMFAKILIDECLYDTYFIYEVIRFMKITLVIGFFFLAGQVVFGVEKFSLFRTINPNIILADTVRYPGFLSDPQTFSQYLAAVSFLCMIKDPREDKLPKYNYLLVVGALVSIMMAGGRAGLLGWALGMGLVVFFGNASYRVGMIIAIIALYFIAVNFGDNFAIFKRSGDMDETYEFRASIWADAIGIFYKYPFFGIGFGNYANYVQAHFPDQVWIIDNEPIYFDHPESGYLKFLTELGALGSICIWGLILVPVVRSFIYYLVSKDSSLILLIAGIVAWMVGFYSTYSMGDTRIKLMVITIVCLLITSRQRLEALYDDMTAETGQEEPENENYAIPA